MSEKSPSKLDDLESAKITAPRIAPDAVSKTGETEKHTQRSRIALAFFLVSAISFIATIVKFFYQYNIEKQAYNALVESGLSQKMINMITNGKSPVNFAFEALLKFPFLYIAIVALLIGFIWSGMKRQK